MTIIAKKTRIAPSKAKPFLKWAGGKTQLLHQLETLYPPELKNHQISTYIEPFIGGGAVFFEIIQKYQLSSAVIYDINPELIVAYTTIRNDVSKLIKALTEIAEPYKNGDELQRKQYFYDIRHQFNHQRNDMDLNDYADSWVLRTALLIFLNRTCFNGLFRLNKKGEFNVPHGRYRNPKIVDALNLIAVSELLQVVEIHWGDFQQCQKYIQDRTFIYFDPPYRPLNATAKFTAYSTFNFDDQQQTRLKNFFAEVNQKTNAKMMLSNSDPHNIDPNDNFLDILYQDFHIHRVSASRMINCNAQKRGSLSEIVVTNYAINALKQ